MKKRIELHRQYHREHGYTDNYYIELLGNTTAVQVGKEVYRVGDMMGPKSIEALIEQGDIEVTIFTSHT
jgi:hypothetical protein